MHVRHSKPDVPWLGHVSCMDDRRIPKVMLYGELTMGIRPVSRLSLYFKDVYKRDMKSETMG